MNISQELAIKISEEARKNNKKLVFTNGCFDLLHIGHSRYLSEAKKFGDILIVGINSNASTKRLKGKTRPINDENDRAELISALESVDYTVIFEEDTPIELIKKIKPSVHIKGGDYKKEELPETEIVENYDGVVHILNFVEGKSTTNMLSAIEKNSVEE